jgi:hypothetical protein
MRNHGLSPIILMDKFHIKNKRKEPVLVTIGSKFMKLINRICISLAIWIPIAACATDSGNHVIAGNYDVHGVQSKILKGHETDPIAQYCKSFSLTEKQIKYFFSNANIITLSELHDNYDLAPCIVSGEISQNGKNMRFEIYASSIARIWVIPQQQTWIACDMKCNSMFSGK